MFRPLHRFNPGRLAYIRDRLCGRFGRDPKADKPLQGLALLDVGCGGGLLSEPLARLGAAVTGIDAAPQNIAVATLHAEESGLAIDYRHLSIEELAARPRSAEHTSELQSLMRISYAVFCLKKKKLKKNHQHN